MIQYYWLIVIILFVVKLLRGKESSSYNIKWMWAYVIYLLLLQIVVFDSNWSKYEDEIWEYTVWAFVLPIGLYLLFPFIWKHLNRWKIFRKIEEIVDRWYDVTKNKC